MEMNYFKKTGKMMVAACMLAGLPFIPGTVSASELQTQMMAHPINQGENSLIL